jgi:hypothetical protein
MDHGIVVAERGKTMTTPDELRALADRMEAEQEPEKSTLTGVDPAIMQQITRLRGGCFEYEPMRRYHENRRPKNATTRPF